MPPSGRSRASSLSSSIGSPKRMKRPPLQVPIAVRVGMRLSLYVPDVGVARTLGGAGRRAAGLPLARPALLRTRCRAELPRGGGLVDRLARAQLARGARGAGLPRRRGRRPLHDRLPHRALALARQPVRLPAALLVLRRALRE